jgi:hypothetical protein
MTNDRRLTASAKPGPLGPLVIAVQVVQLCLAQSPTQMLTGDGLEAMETEGHYGRND